MTRRNFRSSVPKRTTTVSVCSDLLAAAREAGVSLSSTLERALIEEVAEARALKWRESNREAIAAYNEHVEKNGTFCQSI